MICSCFYRGSISETGHLRLVRLVYVFTFCSLSSFTILAYLANNCCFWSIYRERVRQRLALYQGVCPVQMEFSDDAEKTFGDALSYLLVITCTTIFFCSFFHQFNYFYYMIKDMFNLICS